MIFQAEWKKLLPTTASRVRLRSPGKEDPTAIDRQRACKARTPMMGEWGSDEVSAFVLEMIDVSRMYCAGNRRPCTAGYSTAGVPAQRVE